MHRLLTHATLTQLNDRFAKDTVASFAHRVGSPPRHAFAPLYFFVIFDIQRGVGKWVFYRDFILCFMESCHTSVEQQTQFLASVHHVTAGLLSVTACTLHSAMEGGGGMRGASKAVKKKKKLIPELCTGAKKSEALQMVAGSLRAKVWVRLSSPSGVLGNLESNRKSLQHS